MAVMNSSREQDVDLRYLTPGNPGRVCYCSTTWPSLLAQTDGGAKDFILLSVNDIE